MQPKQELPAGGTGKVEKMFPSSAYKEVRKLGSKDQNWVRKTKLEELPVRKYQHKRGCEIVSGIPPYGRGDGTR